MNRSSRRERRNELAFLPHLLTTGNLLCGAASLLFALEGKYLVAAGCIYLGMLFDVLDGLTAQRLGLATPFGIEYDSLADFLTFGIAPAFLAYLYAFPSLADWGWLGSAALITATALRLARFNVYGLSAPSEKTYFQGLPSPASAGAMVGLTLLFPPRPPLPWALGLEALAIALAFLMVSRVPFPHMQYVYRRTRFLGPARLLIVALGGLVLLLRPRIFLAAFFGGYLLLGLSIYLRHAISRGQ